MKYWNKYKYHLILGIGLFLIGYSQYLTPDDLDWSKTYYHKDKIPYGTYVLRESIGDLTANDVEDIEEPISSFLESEPTLGSIVIITETISLDETELAAVLDYIDRGGNIFISAENINQHLLDELGLTIDYSFLPNTEKDSTYLKLIYDSNVYEYGSMYQVAGNSFQWDGEDPDINIYGHNSDAVNFVGCKRGNGNFYLHLDPQAFTNYHILNNTENTYASSALSVLPSNKNIYWDNWNSMPPEAINPKSFLSKIYDNKALTSAFYTIFLILFVYIIFKSKRMQRIIPVVERPRNDSVDFATTIGMLYFRTKDNNDLILKKFKFFKTDLKGLFHLPTEILESFETSEIAKRTGLDEHELIKLKNLVTEASVIGTRISDERIQDYVNIERILKNQLNS
jgi:hypothetical protein